MSKTHTPAPWFVQRHQESSTRAITTTPGSAKGDIANVWAGLGSKDVEADARLIAAAPELLEALRRLEVAANTVAYCHDKHRGNFAAALSDMESEAEAARAAIAKATGEQP